MRNYNSKLPASRGNSFYSSKTHCPQGHEYTEENTYYYNNRKMRMCKNCVHERNTKKRETPKKLNKKDPFSMHECNYYCQPDKKIHAVELVIGEEYTPTVDNLTERFITFFDHYINKAKVKRVLSVKKTEADVKAVYLKSTIYAPLRDGDFSAIMLIETE
jgi:hypothetical protein